MPKIYNFGIFFIDDFVTKQKNLYSQFKWN